jgi:hypothetical protein
MKEFSDLGSLLTDIAHRKSRAGETRFGRSPGGAGAPRELYLAGCAQVAEAFTDLGFAYFKTGPRFRRKEKDLSYQVSFQSSHNNVAGEYVALWVHATVHSKSLNDWRKAHPFPGSVVHDYVAGGQIGNLAAKPSWLEWNLATEFSQQVASAIATIESLALPYFTAFADTPRFLERATAGEIPGMTVERRVECLLALSGQDSAEQAMRNFFAVRPDLLPEYHNWLKRYSEEGVPVYSHMGYAKDLAKMTVAFQLQAPAA